MNANVTRWATRGAIAVVALLVAIQLVPFGRDHTNPPVTGEPSWDSPRTRELAKRACFDCHSNETVWPVYANVAPFSWLVADHVAEGRSKLNFSEFDRPQKEAHEAGEVVAEGEMPPGYYKLLHPSARLDDAELRQLVDGLQATLGGEEGELARGRGGGFPTAEEEGEEDDD
ncbi:MAG: heme-binding domain-containing protein [Alphaproteobacteria bacterium]|nr:heme-binding domain-containing protein [Alphaproteobacteria bacterium]MCB9695487.1 heme-binding domain-containing protein [Alphaproteobacteria bacterium]